MSSFISSTDFFSALSASWRSFASAAIALFLSVTSLLIAALIAALRLKTSSLIALVMALLRSVTSLLIAVAKLFCKSVRSLFNSSVTAFWDITSFALCPVSCLIATLIPP